MKKILVTLLFCSLLLAGCGTDTKSCSKADSSSAVESSSSEVASETESSSAESSESGTTTTTTTTNTTTTTTTTAAPEEETTTTTTTNTEAAATTTVQIVYTEPQTEYIPPETEAYVEPEPAPVVQNDDEGCIGDDVELFF